MAAFTSRRVPQPFRALLWFTFSVVTVGRSAPDDETRAVENLATFARAYGYVRFFHPSDAAAAIDWDKFALLGAGRVRDAADEAALAEALRELFAPLGAGGLAILDRMTPLEPLPPPEPAAETGVTYWQHHGVELSKQSNIYKSRRVRPGSSDGSPLFSGGPVRPVLEPALGGGLRLRLPLILPLSDGRTATADAAQRTALDAKLAEINMAQLNPGDWRLRAAGIVIAWNVFQHFHPYLDRAGVKWEETLRPALRRTLVDRTYADYCATLSELVAKLEDGHGYVYAKRDAGGIPIRVAHIEDQIVITGVASDSAFRKGDVIVSIDGTPALEILRDRERYVSGSPHLRRFRALNQFGEGPLETTAKVHLRRDGEVQSVEHPRARDGRGFFFNPIGEFEFPSLTEIRPGIFYVNLPSTTRDELEARLPQLAAARGVIFDQRWDGRRMDVKPETRINVHQHVIPHLTDETLQASPMLTPLITLPDRQNWSYRESTWPVAPKAPRFKGRVVFINEPPVVSYGETCMAIIADYGLATSVGAPTAGCNGNANYIFLPGGLRVMWTGMEVLKHDRTSFYGTGFAPDVPVRRTLAAVKAGRDEFLEAAVGVIERSGP